MFTVAQVVIHATQPEEEMIKKNWIKFSIVIILLIMAGIIDLSAQDTKVMKEGTVSYISGANIYVRFESTAGIEAGDTLFTVQGEILTPALVVQHLSSISCLCIPVGEITFKTGERIIGRQKTVQPQNTQEQKPEEIADKDLNEQVLTSQETNKSETRRYQDFYGRLSLSSYSNFTNGQGDDYHRFRYTFASQASHISESGISAETYISFTHKLNQWDLVRENLNNALKIYSLALKYELNPSASLWAGRKINPRIANVGAIDGIQFEYNFRKIFVGIAGGTRPDYLDYGFNFNLPEYGIYFGHSNKIENGYIQSSLAFFEQRNGSAIDRRFVYFQHTNSAVKNLNLFSSFEIDLYKLVNQKPANSLSLTSLYLSANYRLSKKVSVFGSYDNRKNVIYYETFRNYSEEILQQASRQGFRLRINYRPVNSLICSADGGTRFRKGDPRPTKTLNGNVSWTKVSGINGTLSLSTNLMQTAFLDGIIYGARYSRDFMQGKVSALFNYRYANFKYVNSRTNLVQNIGEVDISCQINKNLYLSVDHEVTFQEKDIYNRLYLNLRWKF